MRPLNRRVIGLVLISVLALIWGGGLLLDRLIPQILPLDRIKTEIREGIAQSTGIRTEIEALDIHPTLFHGVSVSLNNNVLYDPANVKLVQSGHIDVNVRYLPLLFKGQASISRIAFNGFKGYIYQNSYFFRIKLPKSTTEQVVFDNTRFEFNDYDIYVENTLRPNTPYFLQGEHLVLHHWNALKPLHIEGQGRIFSAVDDIPNPLSQWRLDAKLRQEVLHKADYKLNDLMHSQLTLSDISPGALSPIFNASGMPLDVVGKVQYLQVTYQNQPHEKRLHLAAQNNDPLEFLWQDHLYQTAPGRIEAEISTPDPLPGKIRHLNRLLLKTRHGRTHTLVTGQATLGDSPQNTRMNLEGRLTDLHWDDIRSLPHLPLQHAPWLRHADGMLDAHVFATGSLEHPRLHGTASLSHGELRNAVGTLLAEQLSGHVRFDEKGQVAVEPFSGIVAQSPFNVSGRINLASRKVQGHLWGKRLNLARLQTLLKTVAPKVQERFGPYRLLGHAGANFKIQGPMDKPTLEGQVDFMNTGLAHQNRWVFNHVTGRIQLRNGRFEAHSLAVTLGKNVLHAAGNWNSRQNTLNLGVQGQGLNLATLHQSARFICQLIQTPCTVLEDFTLSGIANLDLHAQGALKQPSLRGNVQLMNTHVGLPRKNLHLAGLNTQLVMDGRTIQVQRFSGKLNEIPLSLSGQLFDNGERLNLRLQVPEVTLSSIQKLLTPWAPALMTDLSSSGTTMATLQINGPAKKPVITGHIDLKQAGLTYHPRHIVLSQMTGRILLQPQTMVLAQMKASLNGIALILGGSIDKSLRKYRVTVTGKNIALASLMDALGQATPEMGQIFLSAGIQGGSADLNLILSPEFTPIPLGGNVLVKNLRAHPASLPMPVYVGQAEYNLGTGQIRFPASGITVGNVPFHIQGSLLGKQYHLTLKSGEIPLSFIRDNQALLEHLTDRQFPTLFNTQGAMTVQATLTPELKEIAVKFLNAGASMRELTYPFYQLNGLLRLDLSKRVKAFTDNLSFRYGNSPMKLAFDINGAEDIYLETTGTLSPMVVNDWFFTNDSTKVAYAALPYEVTLSGKLGQLWGSGLGNNLHMFFNFNVASLFSHPTLANPVQAGDDSLAPATLSSVLHLLGDTLQIEETRFWAGPQSSLVVNGLIARLFSPGERQVHLSLVTDPAFDLTALGKQLKLPSTEDLAGTLTSNVKLDTLDNELAFTGELLFDHVRSSLLALEDLQGNITFKGLKGLLNITHFQIPGVDIGFTAEATDLLAYPLPIENFNLKGKEFIVPLYTEWISNVIVGKLRQGVWEQFFPNTGRHGPLPFEIRNGTLALDEGIINNLIVNDFTSTFRMYPNTYFEMDNVHAKSAGGSVSGHFAMNPRDNNFMTVHMVADKMKANAVSRILLNVTNQIFGDLSGVIDYTTEGMTPEQLLSNTNGYADLRIENGRLPSIAKMENLLVAANTISGGIANLNLNSLFHIASPFNTDYFATLTGTFKMANGIIYTDDMLSDGKNLDLLIQGEIRMVDGISNLLVKGTMDREIGGVLGPLGDFSVGHFLGIFPPLRQIISHIPFVGFIPGFGGPRADKGVAFEVRVQGLATDPGAIKDFKWVN